MAVEAECYRWICTFPTSGETLPKTYKHQEAAENLFASKRERFLSPDVAMYVANAGISLFVQCAPIILVVLFPGLALKLKMHGFDMDFNTILSVVVCFMFLIALLVVLLLQVRKHRKQIEIEISKSEQRSKDDFFGLCCLKHLVFHYIRDHFCAAEFRLSKLCEEIGTEYERVRQLEPKEIVQELDKAFDGVLDEALDHIGSFANGVCQDITDFIHEIPLFDKNVSCCLRIALYDIGKDICGYATVGRSKWLNPDRSRKSKIIYANQGIMTVISAESGTNYRKGVLFVPSIQKAIKNDVWLSSENDNDEKIQSVIIAPINSKNIVNPTVKNSQKHQTHIDGLLYFTSEKTENDCPFDEAYAELCAAIADALGCLIFRLNEKYNKVNQMAVDAKRLKLHAVQTVQIMRIRGR